MKTFSQYITELFDKPLDFQELPWVEPNTTAYVFQLDEKNYYRVLFEKLGRSNQYDISFDHVDKESDLFNQDKGKKDALSGKNAVKVFSTVSAIVREFVKDHRNITGFHFSAVDYNAGREAIYKRLAQKLASELKWHLEILDDEYTLGVIYNVTKNKPK